MNPRHPLIALALALAGCNNPAGGAADAGADSITVTATPPSGAAADGRSIIPVQVTTTLSAADALSTTSVPINLQLFLSEGSWLTPSAATSENAGALAAQITDGSSYAAAFIAGTTPGPVWVYASRGDASTYTIAQLPPASVDFVEVTPVPNVLARGQTNQITLTATVYGVAGASPSVGTQVSFTVTPPVAGAECYPSTTTINPATGAATATLVVAASAGAGAGSGGAGGGGARLEAVTVQVNVQAPPGGDLPDKASATVVISVSP